jgi:protein-S-isoprenylcysteine O-methyltransferase Ste14
MLVRFAPLLSLCLLFGAGIVWRCLHHLRHHGTIGFAPLNVKDWGIAPALALLLGLAGFAQVIAAAFAPEYLAPFVVDLGAVGPVLGALLVIGGTALMVSSQLSLGASWRIGIDPNATPGLVTTGWYRASRNPIFLCMLCAIAGVALLLPTVLSALLVLACWAAVRKQVDAEEKWLAKVYGDRYRAYAARVGRFFPGVGRLT